uniref:non-specific serine/threonine protein kinase n=1 Tax=Nelumbo nucifera TaxID=4432 RepID=A0A822ZYD5_NELNU|nr:TPA_asm: hypothetical protein HUJ06_018312 [Nelumbo nucifera]
MEDHWKLVFAVFLCFVSVVSCATDPNDLKILNDLRDGLDNPELLNWPSNGDDPCGPPSWPHLFCSGSKVSQIQVQGLGLKGSLPQNFNQLKMLSNLGLQRNNFSGKIPTFSGLSELHYAYLGNNQFDTIPSDFSNGLTSLQVLSLDNNPLNASTGWSIPSELQNSAQLTNLSLMGCNLVGSVPDFLGSMPSLTVLKLSYNNLTGEIPASFNQSQLQILWLDNQNGGKMTGPIDVIVNIPSLTQLWLHGNKFSGTIPEGIGQLSSLTDLNLNTNQLVGLIPKSIAGMQLQKLDLSNNMLMGPVPEFKFPNFSYDGNSFCQGIGLPCTQEVIALLDFLGGVQFPSNLASAWKGNDPCAGPWLGVSCESNKVSVINLPRRNLSGILSSSLGKLDSLSEIRLEENHLTGSIPMNLIGLKSLKLLDLSGNNIEPPLPKFSESVKVVIDGNPLFNTNQSATPSSGNNSSSSGTSRSPPSNPSSPPKGLKLVGIVAPLACFASLVLLVVPLSIWYCKKRKCTFQAPRSIVVHPRDPYDPENMVKIAVSNNVNGSLSNLTESSSQSIHSSRMGECHAVEAGNLIVSVQVLRNVTKNFSPENELGRGGFGTVYKGELDDGTKIAVKRMEAGVISNKALDEFQAEIAVLSKVRHRHLVSLLGYSIEGNERLLVYEYVPQGALSKHLFHWRSLNLEPLSWKRRLNIALDVARGMEYLHSLAHQSFIHRDLKSSNILLGDDYRAKVSDFGLVKLAPDGEKSVVTRLAGTFGYLAPEYAGK